MPSAFFLELFLYLASELLRLTLITYSIGTRVESRVVEP